MLKYLSLLFTLPWATYSATWPALSTSYADVRAAINSASDGDLVTMPPGTSTWTTNMIYSTAITLQGAGTNLTIIKDGIVDRTGLIAIINTVPGKVYKLTSFTIQNAPGVDTLGTFGVVQANGQANALEIVDMDFNSLRGINITPTQGVYGVIARNTFRIWTSSEAFEVYHNTWQGVGAYGDYSWAQPSTWGTTNALYFEGNTAFHVGTTPNTALCDMQAGSRVVVRYNNITNEVMHDHGLETSGRYRSFREAEIYGNNMISTTNVLNTQARFSRGGSDLIFSNNVANYASIAGYVCFLSRGQFWYSDGTNSPGANGINGWHSNYTGSPFFTGATSGSTTSSTNGYFAVQIASVSWTQNQWSGYSLLNTSVTGYNGIANAHPFGEVIANTTDTLIYACDIRGPITNMTFTAGNNIALYHVNAALDQVGRGQGSYISGDTPTFVNFNEVSQPCRVWDNIVDGVLNGGNPVDTFNYGVIRFGRDWLTNALPGYTPLTYPHPLLPPIPPPPPTTDAGGVVVTGKVTLHGGVNLHVGP